MCFATLSSTFDRSAAVLRLHTQVSGLLPVQLLPPAVYYPPAVTIGEPGPASPLVGAQALHVSAMTTPHG